MPVIKGFEVAIVVDDEDLPQYPLPVPKFSLPKRQPQHETEVRGLTQVNGTAPNKPPVREGMTRNSPTKQSNKAKAPGKVKKTSAQLAAQAQRAEKQKAKRLRAQAAQKERQSTCLVEATAGKNFEIRVKGNNDFDTEVPVEGLEVVVSIDGKEVDSSFMDRDCMETYSAGRARYLEGKLFVEPFKFAKIKIDSDRVVPKEELKTLKRMYYRLGTIKVRLYRVAVVCGLDNSSSMTKYAREHFRNASDARRVEGMVVPENAVKGQFASLHTTFEDATSDGDYEILSGNFIDGKKKPYLTFEFHCVSRGALQTLGLIPREPSPIPLAQRNLETLTHEETRQLVEQLQSKVDAYTKVKNEWEDLSGVKRPFNVKPDEELSVIGARKSQRPATNDEVIDLD